jgi:CheY-like chemotaxis protein/PAS domain-containing protein
MAIRTVFGNRESREKKSLSNKDYYKTLIESKKDATILADIDGDLFLLNKKAQSLSGFSEEEIRDFHVRDLFFTTNSVENPFDAKQFSEFSSTLYLLDARRYLLPVRIDFREIEGQKFLLTLFLAEEREHKPSTTEFQGSIPEIVQPIGQPAQSMQTSNRLTVEFEHEIRNLLNTVLGFSGIMADDPSIQQNKKLQKNIGSVIKSGTKIKTLLNRLSIGDEVAYEVVRTSCMLGPLLHKAQILLDPVSRQYNVPVGIKQTADITVITDEVLLLDILKYLLTKAMQYTRNEQVVVEISVEPGGNKASIVIDNLGQDIPQGVINFIRRENSNEQYDVNNPALTQSPEIRSVLSSLNLIGGKIGFNAGEKGGEMAKLVLPLDTGEEQPDDLAHLESEIKKRSLNILIVEDDKFNSAILNLYLENLTAISSAFSGNEALNIIEANYNKGIIFNVMIMDIGLPKPWDGILLKAEIEKRWPEYQKIPFLAQTAFTAKSFADRIQESRFSGYLVKPISRSELLRFVYQHSK